MKTCRVEGCPNFIWGKGYCKSHQYLRDDLKRKKHTPVKDKKEMLSFGFENQLQLFLHCWEKAKNSKGEIICPFTGGKLNDYSGTDLWLSCFSHILPKGRYTYWKLNPENICVVNPDFHYIIEFGTMEDRARHPGWKFSLWDQKVYEMKQKYEQFKKSNLLR